MTTDNTAAEQLGRDLMDAAKRSLVKAFNEGTFILPDYAQRIKIPAELVKQVYDLIDYEQVLAILRPKINEMVADRIAAALAQELTTDVKKVLSHEPTRLRLRAAVINTLDKG